MIFTNNHIRYRKQSKRGNGIHGLNVLVIRVVLFLWLGIQFPLISYAQSGDVLLLKGANAFQEGDFFEAQSFYERFWELDSSSVLVAYRLAECYKADHHYKKAAYFYRKVLNSAEGLERFPQSWLFYAFMKKQCGEYGEFCSALDQFLLTSKDPDLKIRALKEKELCLDSSILHDDTLPVRISHLGSTVNTPYSEFGAYQWSDSLLVFSSLRPYSLAEFQSFALSDYRTAVYGSDIRTSGFQHGVEFSSRINRKNTQNANLALDLKNKRAFFSRCYDRGDSRMDCEIMMIEFDGKHWSRPVKLKGEINLSGFTNTQPFYTYSGDQGVLYFVSDRPGGRGGMDIWYSIEDNGSFSKPINGGSIINSPGNEVTPFYDMVRGRLYFSSDWHPGFGGYDIFYSVGGLSSWDRVVNIKRPVNSPANDYYFSVNPNDSNGYFTSNRPGSLHLRGETCCNDIYAYDWLLPLMDPDSLSVPAKPSGNDSVTVYARKLLPLLLFFHNDEPDAATMNTTSSKNFREALDDYVHLKPLYRKEYSKGLRGAEAEIAARDIELFFEDYVLKGYEKLELLTSYIISDLRAGRSVQLMVSGFCSPLSTTEYNINLARRRIHSLIKYLEQVEDGFLVPFLNESDPNGVKLIIFEDPVGKERASPFVSDNPNDLRNSVFSRAAAFERRIEITTYVSHPPGELTLLSEMPRIVFSADTITVRPSLQAGEKRIVPIFYRNDGKSELIIREVFFNGERVWVEWPNEPLLPGKEQKMLMLIHAQNKPGSYMESLSIRTNLPADADLTIRWNVE